MKPFTALALVVLVSSSAAAQAPPGSLAVAAARAGRELARGDVQAEVEAAPSQLQKNSKGNWDRVSRLQKGSEVRIVTRDRMFKDGRLGDVSDDRVLLLSVESLPPGARRALLDVAANYPGYIGRPTGFTRRKLTVNPFGVFYDGVRVADPAVVFTEVPRDVIAELKRPSSGSLPGALGAASVGLAVGYLNTVRLMYKPCGGSCGGETAQMGLSLVGLPLLGAYLGARYTPHQPWTTVYRSR